MKLELRPEVAAFAQLMERTLRENDHKGGWKPCRAGWILQRLIEETDELHHVIAVRDSLRRKNRGEMAETLADEATREAINVANFALMIADVCGGLKEGP